MDIINKIKSMFTNWDRIHLTAECPHCHGTMRAPGDGHTECGFCEPTQKAVDHANNTGS